MLRTCSNLCKIRVRHVGKPQDTITTRHYGIVVVMSASFRDGANWSNIRQFLLTVLIYVLEET